MGTVPTIRRTTAHPLGALLCIVLLMAACNHDDDPEVAVGPMPAHVRLPRTLQTDELRAAFGPMVLGVDVQLTRPAEGLVDPPRSTYRVDRPPARHARAIAPPPDRDSFLPQHALADREGIVVTGTYCDEWPADPNVSCPRQAQRAYRLSPDDLRWTRLALTSPASAATELSDLRPSEDGLVMLAHAGEVRRVLRLGGDRWRDIGTLRSDIDDFCVTHDALFGLRRPGGDVLRWDLQTHRLEQLPPAPVSTAFGAVAVMPVCDASTAFVASTEVQSHSSKASVYEWRGRGWRSRPDLAARRTDPVPHVISDPRGAVFVWSPPPIDGYRPPDRGPSIRVADPRAGSVRRIEVRRFTTADLVVVGGTGQMLALFGRPALHLDRDPGDAITLWR